MSGKFLLRETSLRLLVFPLGRRGEEDGERVAREEEGSRGEGEYGAGYCCQGGGEGEDGGWG